MPTESELTELAFAMGQVAGQLSRIADVFESQRRALSDACASLVRLAGTGEAILAQARQAAEVKK